MSLGYGNYYSSRTGLALNNSSTTRGGGEMASQFKPASDIFASKYNATTTTTTNYGLDLQNNGYKSTQLLGQQTQNNIYGTNSGRNNSDNNDYQALSRSYLMHSEARNGYTTTGSVMYKCGEQLESRYGLTSKNDSSLMDYPKDLVSQQYRQPTYLTKGVYDNYYAGHTDKEMRDQEMKTVIREDINRDREEIIEIFRQMTLLEREVEIIKQSLCLQKDLSFDQVFRFFDSESTNQITPYELDVGLRQLGIAADKIDLYLLVTRYSRDGNDTINVDEFFKMMAPAKVDPVFDQVYVDKSIAFKDMCDLTRSFVVKLFKMLLNQENIVQQFRRDILEKQLDIDALFKAFDKDNNQTITHDELLEWMRHNGIYINDNESKQFFQRFDRNSSGQINLSEFRYELTLKSVGLKRRNDTSE